jgi:hypothetical protein
MYLDEMIISVNASLKLENTINRTHFFKIAFDLL